MNVFSSEALSPTPKKRLQFFNLRDVRVQSVPFVEAMETDKAYLLRLDPHRFLSWFRREAGLEPKAEVYGGWESAGVAGQTLGHYLSALSQMYAATGAAELLDRSNLIVSELAECQRAHGNGYVAATPNGQTIYSQIAQGQIETKDAFTLNGGWVPVYVLHKLFAGLLDAYRFCDNEQAREVVLALTQWCQSVFGHLSHEQMQAVLYVEHGGMAEVLAEVYSLSGELSHLELAKKFRHDEFFVPAANGCDNLNGHHANSQIPKFIGYQRLYELTGEPEWGRAARFFWNSVAMQRSFAIGGNSVGEHFFPLDQFDEAMQAAVGPETCNTYNILKLTRHLFAEHPSGAMMDFYERALYNHILVSQHPHRGGFSYYTAVRPGAYRTYSTDFDSFWCCVGTGMENHAKYGETIYARNGDTFFANLFIASQVKWTEQGATINQKTDFPNEPRTQFQLQLENPGHFTIALRYPGWVASGALTLTLNGERISVVASPGEYIEVEREWNDGDLLSVELPMQISLEMLPQSHAYGAILYGPIILAGVQGRDGLEDADFCGLSAPTPEQFTPSTSQPIIIVPPSEIANHIRAVESQSIRFNTQGLTQPPDVDLVPLYTLHDQRYTVYWPLHF